MFCKSKASNKACTKIAGVSRRIWKCQDDLGGSRFERISGLSGRMRAKRSAAAPAVCQEFRVRTLTAYQEMGMSRQEAH